MDFPKPLMDLRKHRSILNKSCALGELHLLKPMIKVAKMLKRHFENIITYLRHPITNAVTEGLSSKIQAIKANARDLRSSLITARILFFCGKLNLYPL